jgi:hypothetical protein
MPTRQQLHDAIDHLPDNQVDITYRVLLAIADEEPISPELESRILEAAAGIERGEGISTEQLNRELGL